MNNTPRRALCYVKIQNYNDHAVSACLLQRLPFFSSCSKHKFVLQYLECDSKQKQNSMWKAFKTPLMAECAARVRIFAILLDFFALLYFIICSKFHAFLCV